MSTVVMIPVRPSMVTSLPTTSAPTIRSSVKSYTFGMLPSGECVEAWTLRGAGGLVLEAITYGAAVTRLLVPDRQGHLADVVLGFDSLDNYVRGTAYMGAMVGRVAGRISNARFSVEGQHYALSPNDAPNHLHGGPCGFHARVWTAAPLETSSDDVALRMSYASPDGEEGYPGNVLATVTYTLTADNAFVVQTETVSDKTTPCSLTHHAYFNLAGEGSGSICDHRLSVNAGEVAAVDGRMTLTGALQPVSLPGNDLRNGRSLREAIPQLFRQHGDLYRLGSEEGADGVPVSKHAARLSDAQSGRVMDVFTTEEYLQLYTGCGFDGSLTGRSGELYLPYQGLCLECEGYPDGVNLPELGDILLRPGKPRVQTTSYRFSVQRPSAGGEGML